MDGSSSVSGTQHTKKSAEEQDDFDERVMQNNVVRQPSQKI